MCEDFQKQNKTKQKDRGRGYAGEMENLKDK